MARTAATIIREIATTNAAPIDQALKDAIIVQLKAELHSMFHRQMTLPLDQAPDKAGAKTAKG